MVRHVHAATVTVLTCKRGHDTSHPWDRYADGHCRQCQQAYVQSNAYQRYRYSSAGMMADFQAGHVRRLGYSDETPEHRSARLVKPGWREREALERDVIEAALRARSVTSND
jgi:hypothetical protein